VKALKEKFL